MADSKRKRILQEIHDRLASIQIAGYYETDAGLRLFWGPVVLGPDDPPLALAIVPGTTETNPSQDGKKIITLPVEIHIVVLENWEQAWPEAEAVLGDVKRALEADKTLSGLAVDLTAGEVIPLLRQEGGAFLGLRADYTVLYWEYWGDPL